MIDPYWAQQQMQARDAEAADLRAKLATAEARAEKAEAEVARFPYENLRAATERRALEAVLRMLTPPEGVAP